MPFINRNIILRLLFLTVYGAFFIVQLGFNVGTTVPHATLHYLSGSQANNSKGKCVVSTKTSDGKKVNIRLNKRFEPASVSAGIYTLPVPKPILLKKAAFGKPADYLLISSILVDSLRGPPVVIA